MKEYSSLLAVPLQKNVMCGGVLQCRRGWRRAAALLRCSSAGASLLYARNMRQRDSGCVGARRTGMLVAGYAQPALRVVRPQSVRAGLRRMRLRNLARKQTFIGSRGRKGVDGNARALVGGRYSGVIAHSCFRVCARHAIHANRCNRGCTAVRELGCGEPGLATPDRAPTRGMEQTSCQSLGFLR